MSLKKDFNTLKEDFNLYKVFVKTNSFYVFIMSLFIFFAWSIKLVHHHIEFDTLACIDNSSQTPRMWISLDKSALAILKKSLGLLPVTAYASYFLLIVSFIVCGTVSAFMYSYLLGQNRNKSMVPFVFPILFSTSPLFADLLNFVIQAFEIPFAFLLSTIACFLITRWALSLNHKNILYPLIAVLFMAFSFGIYQSIIFIYLSLAFTCYILIYYSNSKNYIKANKNFFTASIIKYASTFIVAFILHNLLNKFVQHVLKIVPLNHHFNSYYMWDKHSKAQCISDIKRYAHDIYFGQGVVYSKYFIIAVILILGYAICNLLFTKNKNKILLFLATAILVILPVSLSIFTGNYLIQRTQCSYQVIFAFAFMFLLLWLKNMKKSRIIAFILVFALGFSQCVTMNQLYEMEYRNREQDNYIAQDIISKIDTVAGEKTTTPIAFVGNRINYIVGALPPQDGLLGISIFQLPNAFKFPLFHYLGRNYVVASPEQESKAKEIATDMPVWPNPDSVKYTDEVIVVKLS